MPETPQMTDEIPAYYLQIYTEEKFWSRFHPHGGCLHYNYAPKRGFNGVVKFAPKIRWMGNLFSVVRVAALYGGVIDSIDVPGQVRHACGDSGCFKPEHLRYHSSIYKSRAQKQDVAVPKYSADRFWKLIDQSERAGKCWIPKSPKHHNGQIYWRGRTRRIARVAAYYNGLLEDLDSKQSLIWSCGSIICCNPKHVTVYDYSPLTPFTGSYDDRSST